jgi:hypothetical protein
MPASPHTEPSFTNAATYTVAITYTVAGGVRHGTADRRAKQVAQRLAGAAARLRDVVEVTATAGRSHDGKQLVAERVRFDAANTGHATYGQPDKLDRYLDVDHERALRSLAEANAAAERRRQVDQERRREISCRNIYRLRYSPRVDCACVYCDPEDHYTAIRLAAQTGPNHFRVYRCVCGAAVAVPGGRCAVHRDVRLVVLDGDGAALQLLARQTTS